MNFAASTTMPTRLVDQALMLELGALFKDKKDQSLV
jgi:hypothetical protein